MDRIEVSETQVRLLVDVIRRIREILVEDDEDERSLDEELAARLDYLDGALAYPKFAITAKPQTIGRPSRDFGIVAIPVHRLTPEAVQELNLEMDPQLMDVIQISKFEHHRHRFVVVTGEGLSAEDTEAMRDTIADVFGFPTVAANYPVRVELYEIERRLGRYEAIIDDEPPAFPAFRFQTRRKRRGQVHFRRRGS